MDRDNKKNIKGNLRRFVRVFPSNNDKVKVVLLCLIAATTFWFFSALNKSDYSTRVEYPISFVYESDSTYVLEELPEYILVQVRGGGWNLLRKTLLLDAPPVEIELDDPVNTQFVTGQSLSQQIAEKLGEVQLEDVLTDTLFFRIDRAAEKELAIAIDSSTIRLADAYQITSPIKMSSEVATVLGPETILADLGDTLYVSLPEQEVDQDFQQAVTLDYSISDLVAILPASVDISFEVAQFDMITRSVQVTAQEFPDDSSLAISPNRVTVSFWIQNKYIDSIESFNFEINANLLSLSLEDSTITPVLESYPSFARDVIIKPAKVRVSNAR